MTNVENGKSNWNWIFLTNMNLKKMNLKKKIEYSCPNWPKRVSKLPQNQQKVDP